MTGTRNPSRKYFKRNQPYFYKSADNWEEWDTDESYDRTFFIGIDDSNPNDIDVALYMIWGGKPVAAVGSKVLDTVSGVVDTAKLLETEIQSILKEVQELSAKVAQSAIDIEQAITEMNALVDRCEGILDGAEAARDLAKDWANKMNGTVDGTEYSAKYYANEAKSSETAAAGSASTASASATTATEQAAAASTSAEQAATSASTAASYASTAHTDASGAANSAQAAQDSATSAANSATNAANSETNSANSATASAASANNSHIWAEGTDAQVQALGGVHSSKVWAEQSTNANIALTNSPYTTNRILEIPQDIKLELNNGTLTLKAGSKVYVPNGFEADGTTPKFDVVTIANDIVYNAVTTTTGTSLFFLYPNLDIGAFVAPDDAKVSYYFSGPTAPTVTLTYALWYDTANNIVKNTFDNGATWSSGNTLPIAVCSYTNGTGVTSIDQVFNGFGYIGSTVFVLPGVKYEYSIDVNPDGSYVNQIWTNPSVKLFTTSNKSTLYSSLTLRIDPTTNVAGNLFVDAYGYHYTAYTPYKYPSVGTAYWFNPATGKTLTISSSGVVGTTAYGILSLGIYRNAGKIDWIEDISINPVNTYSRSDLSGLGMPSGRYIDLTLGASGSTYIAPANGYFILSGVATTANAFVYFVGSGMNPRFYAPGTEGTASGFIPLKKGSSCRIDYASINVSASTTLFRFAYAEGEN